MVYKMLFEAFQVISVFYPKRLNADMVFKKLFESFPVISVLYGTVYKMLFKSFQVISVIYIQNDKTRMWYIKRISSHSKNIKLSPRNGININLLKDFICTCSLKICIYKHSLSVFKILKTEAHQDTLVSEQASFILERSGIGNIYNMIQDQPAQKVCKRFIFENQ